MKGCLCFSHQCSIIYGCLQDEQEKLYLACMCCSFLNGSGAVTAMAVTEPNQQSSKQGPSDLTKTQTAKYWQNQK